MTSEVIALMILLAEAHVPQRTASIVMHCRTACHSPDIVWSLE